MPRFTSTLALLAFGSINLALANVVPSSPVGQTGPQYNYNQPQQQQQFAQSRDWSTSSSSIPVQTSSATFVDSNLGFTGNSFGDQAWSSYETVAPAQSSSIGFFQGNDLISIGLNIVIGLFTFSIILQIVSKIVETPFFENLFDGRALNSVSSDDIVRYTKMAMDAYEKYGLMNKDVPK